MLEHTRPPPTQLGYCFQWLLSCINRNRSLGKLNHSEAWYYWQQKLMSNSGVLRKQELIRKNYKIKLGFEPKTF